MSIRNSVSTMLTYKRPAGSKTERRFINRFLKPLGMQQDRAGNLYKKIGDSPILYSCHTDTVHGLAGQQYLSYYGGKLRLHPKERSSCLGADDGAGIWLMREMIKAKHPGTYVFHRGEEVGCVGSKWIAKHAPHMAEGIKAAIAFDRRGTNSIITRQWRGRCCSDAFADSLSKAIGLGHKKDTGGSVTDTAQYMDLVGECTNISVGYDHEHSNWESLDLKYLEELRDAMLAFDHSNLDYVRKPGETEPYQYTQYNHHWDEYDYGRPYEGRTGLIKRPGFIPSAGSPAKVIHVPDGVWEKDENGEWYKRYNEPKQATLSGYGWEDPGEKAEHERALLYRLVEDNPDEIADLLEDYGLGAEDVADYVYAKGGDVPSEMLGRNLESETDRNDANQHGE